MFPYTKYISSLSKCLRFFFYFIYIHHRIRLLIYFTLYVTLYTKELSFEPLIICDFFFFLLPSLLIIITARWPSNHYLKIYLYIFYIHHWFISIFLFFFDCFYPVCHNCKSKLFNFCFIHPCIYVCDSILFFFFFLFVVEYRPQWIICIYFFLLILSIDLVMFENTSWREIIIIIVINKWIIIILLICHLYNYLYSL